MSRKPLVSWLPVRLLHQMDEGELSWEDWIRRSAEFGLDGVEIHHNFIGKQRPLYLKGIKQLLDELKIKVSLITCSPDFTHPDPAQRKNI